VASIWVLEIAALAAKVDLVVSGMLVALLALYELWDATRPARRQA
jgi:hypothetical protein